MRPSVLWASCWCARSSVNSLAQHLPGPSGVAEALGGGTSAAPPPGTLRERARRTGVLGRALEPLMCGPLLKRRRLGNGRCVTVSVDGEFTCPSAIDKGAAPCFVQVRSSRCPCLLSGSKSQCEDRCIWSDEGRGKRDAFVSSSPRRRTSFRGGWRVCLLERARERL